MHGRLDVGWLRGDAVKTLQQLLADIEQEEEDQEQQLQQLLLQL